MTLSSQVVFSHINQPSLMVSKILFPIAFSSFSLLDGENSSLDRFRHQNADGNEKIDAMRSWWIIEAWETTINMHKELTIPASKGTYIR